MIRIGFIGTGNMGGAIAEAVAHSSLELEIMLSNRTMSKAEALAERIGLSFKNSAAEQKANESREFSENGSTAENINSVISQTENNSTEAVKSEVRVYTSSNAWIAETADYIFLGVKPQMMAEMLNDIAPILKERDSRGEDFVLVTMAAGLDTARISELAGGTYRIIRIMPNTPCSIGEGMILYAADGELEEERLEEFIELMSPCGRLSRLSEKLIDAGSAVSGCGPAFVYMFIEALADGGVLCGLPRDKAMEFAAQMVAGSARMVLESGRHPGALKDAVCSPGGTTIEGVRTLEDGGFRGTVMEAVAAAFEKNSKLG